MSYEKSEKEGRVLLGLSGGAHSAVAGMLLRTQGYEVVCAYVDVGCPAPLAKVSARCAEPGAKQPAEKIAAKLESQLNVIDAKLLFEDRVLEYTIHELVAARAPHPCVPCHGSVRIESLLQAAARLRCDFVATGHGARVVRDPRTQESRLYKSTDARRDHSFFLFGLTQPMLQRLDLPLGNFPKNMVEKLAREFGFEDGIPPSPPNDTECLINTEEFSQYFEKKTANVLRPHGMVKSVTGQVLGEHLGVHRYRLATSNGLAPLLDEKHASEVLISHDPKTHTLLTGPIDTLNRPDLMASGANWLRPFNQLVGMRAKACLRNGGPFMPCLVTHFETGVIHVQFDSEFGPIIAGQPIVFYQDDELVGGAWIFK